MNRIGRKGRWATALVIGGLSVGILSKISAIVSGSGQGRYAVLQEKYAREMGETGNLFIGVYMKEHGVKSSRIKDAIDGKHVTVTRPEYVVTALQFALMWLDIDFLRELGKDNNQIQKALSGRSDKEFRELMLEVSTQRIYVFTNTLGNLNIPHDVIDEVVQGYRLVIKQVMFKDDQAGFEAYWQRFLRRFEQYGAAVAGNGTIKINVGPNYFGNEFLSLATEFALVVLPEGQKNEYAQISVPLMPLLANDARFVGRVFSALEMRSK